MKINVSHVRILVTGINTERFLNILLQEGIRLYSVRYRDEGTYVKLSVSDYKKIRKAVRVTGVHTVIVKRYGIRFFMFRNRHRYFFVIGILMFVIFNIFLTGRIYKINIEGNIYYSAQEIYDFIRSEGVDYGKRTGGIDCDGLEFSLRNKFDCISWVSVNVDGSCLKINIRENASIVKEEQEEEARDIVATEDGEVVEMIVRAGTPMVRPGDKVTKGTILVSSRIEYTNFFGEICGFRHVASDADILIKVNKNYNKVTNRNYEVREYTGRTMEVKGIKLLDYYMKFGDEKCKYEHYDTETIYENIQYDMNKIPITYFYQTFREYNLVTKEYTDEELLGRAEQEFNEYILNLEEKSIQILEKSVNIQVYGESAVATGNIITLEPAYTTAIPEIDTQKEAEN